MCNFSSKSGVVPFQISFFLGDLTRNDPSTSTHIKICSKVKMDIQSRVNFGWTKYKGFPQIMSTRVKMAIFYEG